MPKAKIGTTTAHPEAPKRRRGAETEQKFLDAANEVFWLHGFAGSTIARIVEAGDLSVGSFYHLFADKSDLLERATERPLADFRGTLDGWNWNGRPTPICPPCSIA